MGNCCNKLPKEKDENVGLLAVKRKSSGEQFTKSKQVSVPTRVLSTDEFSQPRSFKRKEREEARKEMFDKIHQDRSIM
eukprot:gene403-6817_t